jgi:rRNA maturation endonuclease Nob1
MIQISFLHPVSTVSTIHEEYLSWIPLDFRDNLIQRYETITNHKCKCSHCGQWGEKYDVCDYCGAPIDG